LLQLYFIRHGQSTNNAWWQESNRESYLGGREADPDLTEKGMKQAEFMAEHVGRPLETEAFDSQNRHGFGLTHLYCSLMIRAVKTGQLVAEKTGLELVAMPDVHETGGMFVGDIQEGEPVFKGVTGPGRSYFEANFPNLVLPEDLSEEGWWNREKEPREEYQPRAHRVIQQLLEAHQGQDHRVGIVMHGGIFARILTGLFDVQAEDYWFLMNNCAITRVDVEDDGHVRLVYLNKADFLPDDLVT
jgi:2,3-bisphosphoglycerate-dependent phosphoglycerate mutase